MRVLGIDPGLRLTGYGCVDIVPGHADPILVEAGVLRLPTKGSLPHRLGCLHDDLEEVITGLQPDRLVVEQLFSHYKHVQTGLLMAHARGVVLLSASRHDLELGELAPTEVKKSLTGHGHASKQQMQFAVMGQLGLAEPPSPNDVADAIAIALCDARRLDPVQATTNRTA
ncbi:MAG: Holliday junction resolvase [Phycisphaerae bacterium]|nr:Holliday junction resolvase [Phycisphaerae bacterium]